MKGNLLLRNVLLEGCSCDIYIKDGTISRIGSALQCGDGIQVLDGRGMSVLPAFVNMHTHPRHLRGHAPEGLARRRMEG